MQIKATRLETEDDIRDALARYRAARREADGAPDQRDPPGCVPLFRPTDRPATPTLTILDDGQLEGEVIRVRQPRLIIGRKVGQLVIAHDPRISSRHAELRRVPHRGSHRWYLLDLKSSNGSFVRIRHALLSHGQEFLLGRTRLRFDFPATDGSPSEPAGIDDPTRPWQSRVTAAQPAIVLIVSSGEDVRVALQTSEFRIGRDGNQCHLPLADDPFADPVHARLLRDSQGRWRIENNRSVNGVWLRVQKMRLSASCRFQLGEQQFHFRLPPAP